MYMYHKTTQKLILLAIMIAIDFILSPLFRIEGMAPMSSVINIIGALAMGPLYVTLMASICGILRMLLLGIPPLALTGAIFGALCAGSLAKFWPKHRFWGAALGEIVGTGIIGSLLSYPVMVWFTGQRSQLFWLVYTPRFLGATLIGSLIAGLVLSRLSRVSSFIKMQKLFGVIR